MRERSVRNSIRSCRLFYIFMLTALLLLFTGCGGEGGMSNDMTLETLHPEPLQQKLSSEDGE